MTSARLSPVLACTVIMILALLVYANSLHGAFVFDDQNSILGNPVIKDLSRIGELFQGSATTNPFRALPAITFALNYHLHGYQVEGYHIVNLALHIANGWLVFVLLRSLFRLADSPTSAPTRDAPRGAFDTPDLPALLAALLFIAHPVLTAGVTYVTQRHGEMATLFYLSGILAFIKAVTATRTSTRVSAVALTGLCYVAGLCSKEIAVTLPLILGALFWLILAPRMSLDARSIKTMAGMGIILLVVAGGILVWHLDLLALLRSWLTPQTSRGPGMGPWGMGQNLLTQLNVIVQYLSLLAVPTLSRLNADRHFPLAETLVEFPTGLSFLIIIACLWLGWRLRKQAPLIALGIIWFFITLLPSSSVIPLRDLMVEYRLYLPSIGVFLVFVAAGDRSLRFLLVRHRLERWAPVMLTMIIGLGIILPFALTASARNTIWQSPVSFWTDAIRKDPTNVRAYINLGKSYYQIGELEAARQAYQAALTYTPTSPAAHNNMGTVLLAQGKTRQALKAFATAVHLKPDYADAHNNVGAVLHQLGQTERAIAAYQEALRHDPLSMHAHFNLGLIFYQQSRLDAAAAHLRHAIQLEPRKSLYHYVLGMIEEARGNRTRAETAYRRAVELDPTFREARHSLEEIDRPSEPRHDSLPFEQARVPLVLSQPSRPEPPRTSRLGPAHIQTGG